MDPKISPYKILGVQPDATPEEITKAYRNAALKYHPDRNPNGATQFKSINAAYTLLSDPVRRGLYDATGRVDDGDPTAAATASTKERSHELAQQIASFYATYRGSPEESADAVQSFTQCKGSFVKMIREDLLFDNGKDGEVERIRDLIQSLIDSAAITESKVWQLTSSERAVRKLKKELAEERKEAEKVLSETPDIAHRGNEDLALIVNPKKRKEQWDSMADELFRKYCKKDQQPKKPRRK